MNPFDLPFVIFVQTVVPDMGLVIGAPVVHFGKIITPDSCLSTPLDIREIIVIYSHQFGSETVCGDTIITCNRHAMLERICANWCVFCAPAAR